MNRVVFYFAHPAHFHLFKHVIRDVLDSGLKVMILYNDKDVLEELVRSYNFHGAELKKVQTIKKVDSKNRLIFQFIQKFFGTLYYAYKYKPDLIVGTPIILAFVAKIIRAKSIIVNEDDFDVIKQTADFGYPYADHILCPVGTRTGNFDSKSIKYFGLHELAYLHPDQFRPDKNVLLKYGIKLSKPFVIMRFSNLNAHHDTNINGITDSLALEIIDILKPEFEIYITSERKLSPLLDEYRLHISPIEIHHIMALSSLFIGDSQTMSAESAVLGVPFIRYNGFVGKISYLNELENHYNLGFGVDSSKPHKLKETIQFISQLENRKVIFSTRLEKLLSDKINTAKYLSWFIKNYPQSLTNNYKN